MVSSVSSCYTMMLYWILTDGFSSYSIRLGFHSNNIKSIPEKAFVGNPSLITMTLNGASQITEFPDLTGTASLESLDLRHNEMCEIRANTFQQLFSLRSL
ncbi:hypothetical protein J1605_008702 [Eschrichtius robustus]|uniref:Uncharacterized protein n=1 Tax=Eschrichtius robustus TaxID=9764 RepID=A0AB34GVZ8_ESCRO|nr:hypothetical protein J1605_008702 [Eschrichtius robustus]